MQTEGYSEIPLKDRVGNVVAVALVDPEDEPSVRGLPWFRNSNGYACRGDGCGGAVLLHRQLLGLRYGDGKIVDHISRDKLDNRRSNLRVVTHAQNMRNTVAQSTSTSPFRGVAWSRSKKRWRAQIGLAGKDHHLGWFRDEIDAAHAVAEFLIAYVPESGPDPEMVRRGLL